MTKLFEEHLGDTRNVSNFQTEIKLILKNYEKLIF